MSKNRILDQMPIDLGGDLCFDLQPAKTPMN